MAVPELLERWSPSPRFWRGLRLGAAIVIVLFALRSFDRARVWRTPFTVMADSVANYPNGVAAKTQRATAAARSGDVRTAVSLLREAHARGYNRLDHLLRDSYGPLQGQPEFEELKKQWAREWIDRLSRNDSPSQHELQPIAQAQIVLGDLEAARDTIARAIEIGGPLTPNLEVDLEEIERAIRFSQLRNAR